MRTATATGTAYKSILKDIDVLEKHHSRPVYVKVRELLPQGMSEWIAPKQWWGRGSNSTGYSSDYYYGKGSGKGSFAEKEQSARRERQKENKKKGTPPKGTAKGSSTQPVEEKSAAVDSKEAGPSYATMLKQNKMPEAKRQQAASAIEELLTESAGEDRAKLLGHLRALIPDASSAASSSETSLKTRIHRVGNALGKATAKVAKQTEEIELKQRTWEKCSLAIREWAANQRKAFEKDIAEAKDALEKAQQEEKEAMTQLKELQAQLEQQGVEEDPYTMPMDETDLFDTPPTLQPKDTGMTPLMKKLSLELQEANVEKEELKRQNQMMMEETQKLFRQIQQQEKQNIPAAPPQEEVMAAEELQKKLEQDRLRGLRQKQLEKARAIVAKEQLQETERSQERERSPRKGDSQTSAHSLNSLT